MPAPSKIDLLPENIRAELNRQLVKRAFSDYEALARWLAEQGFQIGKSTVGRYGQKLERKLDAIRASTEAARSIAAAAPDDADLRSAAVMSLVQTEIFDVLVNLQEASDEDVDQVTRVKLLSHAAKNIATLSRASVNQKKWSIEIRQQERERAAEIVAETARAQGMNEEQARFWRDKVLKGK
jgi:hypothetical protein